MAHVASLRVLDFEASRLAADPLMCAAIEKRRAALQALERRRLEQPDGADEYARRLEAAIDEEKARSREAKQSGNTKEALHALKRAKLMIEELDR